LLDKEVIVIGAGLAGCEAAWQLANSGVPVKLIEMRPIKSTPAHHTMNLENWFVAIVLEL